MTDKDGLETGAVVGYGWRMSKVEQIESEIAELSPAEARQVAKWLEELLADEWDRQIAADAKAGKLDRFIDEALEEHRQGKPTPLP